ncbi:MAG: MBL fold metallo-hydrolase [Desulfosporosinus sp.]|nr:MBL fold metallo-hydrolase [Desulfosporosinus sp.]
MKIKNLFRLSEIYTSNVYLLTGDWNALEDKNTLIDVGRDPGILRRIEESSTGVGKHKIEQVFLTHTHYDHASLLPIIKRTFNPKVFAYSSNLKEVDIILKGGELLQIADRQFEVIHTPGHSTDSVCLYCAKEKVLFAGDTPLIIRTKDNTYAPEFVQVLEYLVSKKIERIYFGHGDPLSENCLSTIQKSLQNIT